MKKPILTDILERNEKLIMSIVKWMPLIAILVMVLGWWLLG
jgi:hypothetical protein